MFSVRQRTKKANVVEKQYQEFESNKKEEKVKGRHAK